MCGIAGIVAAPESDHAAHFTERALRLLEHRGPDDYGVFGWSRRDGVRYLDRPQPGARVFGDVVFVHRRLSILDLNPTGWQPMGLPDGSAFITFNGEIYNYLELRRELEGLGHVFVSQSDTEVLLHAYRQWGMTMLTRLIGMFAFALLDTVEKRVYLARDNFGIKPLFYVFKRGMLGFASEAAALMELPGVSRKADLQAVCEYARFGATDHEPQTLMEDILQLMPAHYAVLDLENGRNLELKQYWRLDLDRRLDVSFETAAAQLRNLFLESVELHMRSDVPYGAALSGGIDSSSIVMAMREVLGRAKDFPVFSYIPSEGAFSEEPWIDLVAREADVRVTKVRPTANDLVSEISDLISAQQEPFGSTSIYAQYKIFEAVHACGIKVLLDGQGADEMLAGYRPYVGARIASLLRQRRLVDAAGLLARASQLPGTSLATNVLYTLNYFASSATKMRLAGLVGKETTPPWFNRRWLDSRGIKLTHSDFSAGGLVLRHALADGLTRAGIPHLLRYEDRNSMRFSVESRVPFLNVKLVEYVFALPEEYLIDRNGISKAIFRRAMRGLVPDAILDRKDKIGFATPESEWLRQSRDWVDGILGDPALGEKLPFLDAAQIRAEWERFKTSGKAFDWRFWRWINLVEWSSRFGVRYA